MDRINKNNRDKENELKEETQLIKEIQSILQEEYGYSPNQIEYDVPLGTDSQRRVDLIVFDENKSPLIIVEIKKGKFVLPLSEYQLKELLLDSKANFGLLYNGVEKYSYERIGNSIVQIKDIPKNELFEKKSTIKKNTEKLKFYPLFEDQILRIAERVRVDFFDYDPLLQVLALKILDEEKYEGNLFEKFYTKPFDKDDVIQLIKVGYLNFPSLFSSTRYLNDPHTMTKFIELLETIKNFSLQKSELDTITKAILKFSLHRQWSDFPEELSYFMLNLLSIQKNKKILAAYGLFGYNYHISKFLEKYFKLNKRSLNKYLENYLTITEVNTKLTEVIQIISLLRKESSQVLKTNFLKLDQKFIDNFEYIFCVPPIGAEIHHQDEFKNMFSYHGRQLINYVFLKLERSQKSKSKVAILVSPNFLFAQGYTNLIRLSILKPGFLRAIIHLPHDILTPPLGIPMALIIIDFHEPNIKNRNWQHVFLSQIPEMKSPSQKLDLKVLTQVVENFKKFENGHEFDNTSLSFVLHQNKLTESWTVSDKTPEMQKILEIPYGVKLSSLGKIFYGKPSPIEMGSEQNSYKIPYLRISDIRDGLINYPVQRTVTIRDNQKYSEILIQENDILLSCQATIGKVGLARKKDVGILPSPQIVIIRPNRKKILPEYLVQALNTEKVQYQLERKSQGTFISRLNKDDLGNVIVPNPPLSKQKRLVEVFRKEKAKIENLEKELDEAKKNLLKLDFGD